MRDDDIMRELRRIRGDIARKCGFDLHRIAEYCNQATAHMIGPDGNAKPVSVKATRAARPAAAPEPRKSRSSKAA